MNIEYEEEKILSTNREKTKTPEKRPSAAPNFLSLTEKCRAYVAAKDGKSYKSIALEMGRNRRPLVISSKKVFKGDHLRTKVQRKDAILRVQPRLTTSTGDSS